MIRIRIPDIIHILVIMSYLLEEMISIVQYVFHSAQLQVFICSVDAAKMSFF